MVGAPYNYLYGEVPPERGTFLIQASGIQKGKGFRYLKYLKGYGNLSFLSLKSEKGLTDQFMAVKM